MARLRNHLAGLLVALAGTGVLLSSTPTPRPLTIGLVTFVGYLGGLALHMWVKTTFYWYRRGTRRAKYWNCGDCGRRIYRKAGDWITTCQICGWRPGYLGIRWLWHSVPAVEARRRFWLIGLIRVSVPAVVVATGLVVGISGPGALPIDEVSQAVEDLNDDEGAPAASASITPTPSEGGGVTVTSTSRSTDGAPPRPTTHPDNLDRNAIERAVHREINDRRADNGLSTSSFDPALRDIARSHSKDMAEQNYFSHTAPDGDEMGDRYREAGYECRVPTSENRYLTGAENIAYTYAYQEIRRSDGVLVSHDGDEQAIAEGIVYQWMHSAGHRKNILIPEWRREGIGVYIEETSDGTRVYATQNFC